MAGWQIFAMSLRFKSFKEVCKWSYIQLSQILQLKLQFTPNFKGDGMFDVAHAEVNKSSAVEKHAFLPYSVTYDTFNCSKIEFCATLRCFVALALCWKSPPECLFTGGISWNNSGFLHMSCICQSLQVLYINPCLLKM